MKVSLEQATLEITEWLDYKKVSEKKREAYKESIDSLIEAVSEGALIVNEDKTLTHELKFEIGEEMKISKLTYKPRLSMGKIHNHMQGVKTTDGDGRILAYVSALSDQTKGLIKGMDTEDYAISQAVAVFFV